MGVQELKSVLDKMKGLVREVFSTMKEWDRTIKPLVKDWQTKGVSDDVRELEDEYEQVTFQLADYAEGKY